MQAGACQGSLPIAPLARRVFGCCVSGGGRWITPGVLPSAPPGPRRVRVAFRFAPGESVEPAFQIRWFAPTSMKRLALLGAGGGRWIRTTEGVSQQIYSLPPLAAWVSLQDGACTGLNAALRPDANSPLVFRSAKNAYCVDRTPSCQHLARVCGMLFALCHSPETTSGVRR